MTDAVSRKVRPPHVRTFATLTGGTLFATNLIYGSIQATSFTFYLLSAGAAFTWYQSVWNLFCIIIGDKESFWLDDDVKDTSSGRVTSIIGSLGFTIFVWVMPIVISFFPQVGAICYGCDVA